MPALQKKTKLKLLKPTRIISEKRNENEKYTILLLMLVNIFSRVTQTSHFSHPVIPVLCKGLCTILMKQQVHYPSNPQQPGPIYFKTARKCSIFGICCEAIPRQINYFIDVSVATGKGANTTISYIHDFLQNHGAGETDVHFHADNCGGQNKNYVLWYWCWRCIHGQHENITYSFLVAGNIKFSPDWCFGLMKQQIRRTLVSSLFDVLEANDKSTLSSVNCGKLVGLHNGTVLVKTYDLSGHLAPYFKKLIGISKFHHFRINKNYPGKVFLQGICRCNFKC